MAVEVLSPVEMALLAAVSSLSDEAYGLAVYERACKESGVKIAYGSLYPTLDRLQDNGLVSSRLESDSRRGGRPRRYFQLEAAGQRAYNSSRVTYAKLAQSELAPGQA
jgi:PadR family transcriptional regulator, regulatory protein PadR